MRPLVDPRALPESAFQNQVISLAEMYGWGPIFHAPAGGKGGRVDRQQRGAGFPDLVMLHVDDRRLLFAELKTDKGLVSAKQRVWIAALQLLGPPVEVHLWKPEDWDEMNGILRPRSWS